jgi:hypothetical protein
LFILLEVACSAPSCFGRDRSRWRWAVALLLLLPWTRFGPNNDLLMRASIPALAILWLTAGGYLDGAGTPTTGPAGPGAGCWCCCFVLGAVTPLLEIQRALGGKRWPADTGSRRRRR